MKPLRSGVVCLALIAAACSSGGMRIRKDASAGGQSGHGSGGATAGSGGIAASGGATSSGGATGTGGMTASGGVQASGGTTAAGGQGGEGTGGATSPGTGGTRMVGSGGNTGSGGAATGGTTSTSTGAPVIDCNATMPIGGTDHCGQNVRGTAGDQIWSLWSNAVSSDGCITTFSTPAFSARWNDNGDFLARFGLDFVNPGTTFDQYGTIKADFTYTKDGDGGGYSYIGSYGWTSNPCVEWYIVDDRFGTMPFNPYNATQKGIATIDGESYKLFHNVMTGTGDSRCGGVAPWNQYWSVRQKARQCGTITISDHFQAWKAAGMQLGGLLEVKIVVETGGGQGRIDFPIAKVTAQ
jgi:endo-1,4-beta-xylanase